MFTDMEPVQIMDQSSDQVSTADRLILPQKQQQHDAQTEQQGA